MENYEFLSKINRLEAAESVSADAYRINTIDGRHIVSISLSPLKEFKIDADGVLSNLL